MEPEYGLLLLALIIVPILGVVGFALALASRSRIAALERRIATLEAEIGRRAAGVVPADARPSAAPQPQQKPAPQVAPRPANVVPPTPKPAAAPQPPKRSLEERLGARWSVIVGGLALALGGVFLVRYSIEQGLLGPAARTLLGAAFASGLLALGERMRRAEARAGRPRRAIDIPAVVTSAGAVSAFATVYAAYALYGFIGPAPAFVLLGAVAVATLLAAALHGPVLGAVGLIGAHAAPLLVSSTEPNLYALLTYLLAPTAAAFAVARIRNWPALALAAGLAGAAWGALAATGVAESGDGFALIAYASALVALAAALRAGEAAPPRPPVVPNALIALFGLLALAGPVIDGFAALSLAGLALLLAAMLALAARVPVFAPAAVASAALAGLAALSFDDAALALLAETTTYPMPGDPAATPVGVARFLVFAAVLGAVHLAGGAYAARRAPATPLWRAGCLAAAAVAAPLALLGVAYWRVAGFATDFGFAACAALLAAVYVALSENAVRREASASGGPAATAAYVTGAAAALGLALAMAMRDGALTVALAFLTAALGYAATARPIRALGFVAVAAASLVAARVAIDPRIVGEALSSTPVFNALLWGYGAPAAAFWFASRRFDRAGQPWPAQVLEGAALLFALLLGFAQARHLAHGDLVGDGVRLLEAGLDATVAFGLAALVGRLRLKRASPVLAYGALAAGGLGVAVALLGLFLAANPLFTGEPVGDGVLLNALLPGYLVPALAAAAAARFAAPEAPTWVARVFGGVALALGLAWASLVVRRAFAGATLDGPITSDPEWYAYSAVWLVFGLATLAAGVARRSKALRLASAAVVTAVTLKVFLFDMAGLGGALRALSFMGLGAVLVGIGLVYQRLLAPRASA
ncbi:DUF2339 domain-containing protein [Methylopila henanensis]|uniref:DUF2339 domain-containing protein n=1 Tax=Methylopila henanensis TaxID=873516 RepID=A0ABW4KAL7_9HYPH